MLGRVIESLIRGPRALRRNVLRLQWHIVILLYIQLAQIMVIKRWDPMLLSSPSSVKAAILVLIIHRREGPDQHLGRAHYLGVVDATHAVLGLIH